MLKEMLIKIISEFQNSRNQSFKNHPMANYIRDDTKKIIKKELGEDYSNYIIDASPGLGQWSHNAWINIMHPQITNTARKGYYPVYLFSDDSETILFELGQGYTEVRNKYGAEISKQLFQTRAKIMRSKLPELSQNFKKDLSSVSLRPNDPVKERWVTSGAFGKWYKVNNMPSNEELVDDLKQMISLYEKLIDLKGWTVEDEVEIDQEIDELRIPAKEKKILVRHKNNEKVVVRRNTKFINDMKKNSNYCCEACGLHFKKIYGQKNDFIEAHHIVPVSEYDLEIGESRKVAREDFALLCSNCHRMIHRFGVPSLKVFKEKIIPKYQKLIKEL